MSYQERDILYEILEIDSSLSTVLVMCQWFIKVKTFGFDEPFEYYILLSDWWINLDKCTITPPCLLYDSCLRESERRWELFCVEGIPGMYIVSLDGRMALCVMGNNEIRCHDSREVCHIVKKILLNFTFIQEYAEQWYKGRTRNGVHFTKLCILMSKKVESIKPRYVSFSYSCLTWIISVCFSLDESYCVCVCVLTAYNLIPMS